MSVAYQQFFLSVSKFIYEAGLPVVMVPFDGGSES